MIPNVLSVNCVLGNETFINSLFSTSNLGFSPVVSTSKKGVDFKSNFETLNVGGTIYCSGK